MSEFELGELEIPDAILRQLELDAEQLAGHVLEVVGIRTIAYLRSLTGKMQPPVHGPTQVSFTTKGGDRVEFTAYASSTEQPRPAHPGGWADVTGDLARAYAWDVKTEKGGALLVLSNNMEYAAALEAKDGYFVLRGVTDPGGPVEKALVATLAEIAPEWELKRA